MSGRDHHYKVEIEWTGDRGTGTSSYTAYDRDHLIIDPEAARPSITGSSDPAFRGANDRWNPEQLLLAAISSCHQLAYLHLCAVNKVVVRAYLDRAEGWMSEDSSGGGRFTRAVLRPQVTIAAGSDADKARALHHDAGRACFIAASLNFAVEHEPQIIVADGAQS
jgi:organic hydroperoxide reductase OsmC/OhrA